jgi:hypothetical protein
MVREIRGVASAKSLSIDLACSREPCKSCVVIAL